VREADLAVTAHDLHTYLGDAEHPKVIVAEVGDGCRRL
jgi:hypothetical protein